jgi:hypothetical protein
VEVFIDYLGQFPSEAAYSNKVVDAGTQYPLQATELFQQLASFDRSQARYGFQDRLAVALGPLAPVSRNRKPMCLVAHALDEMQGARIRGQYKRRIPAQQE